MESSDWIVTEAGCCEVLDEIERGEKLPTPYRLYRLLADLDDILETQTDDRQRLRRICPIVKQFLTDSPWLEAQYLPPDPQKGWSVVMLYDEPDYPLTVQMVAWQPGQVSRIHNHAAWGIVALLQGREKNTLWQRSPDPEHPDRIERVCEQILEPGETIGFLPEAIHCIEAMGDEPTVSFNLYGKTNYSGRFEFDPIAHRATKF
ncbi:MAG: cupin [Cyanobacteriota bacterium]|nr:cupin [Cyanobacteriota bacterium]